MFQILVEPIEEHSLPEYAVLWFGHPVTFVGEIEELRRDSTHTSDIESLHTLCDRNTEIIFVVDDEDRSVPLLHRLVWRVGVRGIRFLFPERSAVIPVGKPHLFCLAVHRFAVEDSAVGDEALETFLVMSGKPIDAIATERSTDRTEVFGVAPWFFGDIVDGSEVILHTLTSKVAGYLFVEGLSETWYAMSVRENNHIAISLHDRDIPTRAPELRDCTFRSALTIEQGRELMVRVVL